MQEQPWGRLQSPDVLAGPCDGTRPQKGRNEADRLSTIEQAIVAILLEGGNVRRTTHHLLAALEPRVGPVGEGGLKVILARLTRPEVGILDNDKGGKPPGYR